MWTYLKERKIIALSYLQVKLLDYHSQFWPHSREKGKMIINLTEPEKTQSRGNDGGGGAK